MVLTKGSKKNLKEFDKYVRLRRAYLVKLLTKYSAKYTGNGVVYKNRTRATNAMHHNVMNNLRRPASQYWKKVKGHWECKGCRLHS